MILNSNCKGFTLVELLTTITIMIILSLITQGLYVSYIDEAQFDQTREKLTMIRNALVGNPNLVEGGSRKSFGFFGDLGSLPTETQGILALVDPARGPFASYQVRSNARIGTGWNGPYLQAGSNDADLSTDAWGEPIRYNPNSSPPTLVSLGADRKIGGTGFDQDITVEISTEMLTTTVSGFVCLSGGPYTNQVEVEINYPDGSGNLTQSTKKLYASDEGHFSFNNVPLGVRSVSVYAPDKLNVTKKIGPLIITIDRPNYLISCNLLDLNQ
jgi:prepilin-type N-terminal cleavage/methylation domain-containing protein